MLDVPNSSRKILCRRQDPAERQRRRRCHHLQQSRKAQRDVAGDVGRARQRADRAARQSRCPRRDHGRRRRQGVRLGRRYQPVRKDPPQRGRPRRNIPRRSEAQRALLANYPKPTIACIRGFCLGGGMQVAMLADIRFASDNSQFGIPAAKLGIAYGYDGLQPSGLAGRPVLGAAHHVYGHADRLRGSGADRPRRSRPAGCRIVGRDHGDRAHHFRQRAARDQGRQDHHRAGAERPESRRDMEAIKADRHRLHGLGGFPRGPHRLHGKAQAAVHGTNSRLFVGRPQDDHHA